MDNKLKNLKLDLLLKELKLLDLEKEYVDEFTKHYRPIFMDVLSKNGYKPQIITGETLNTPIKKENKISVDENELKTIKTIFRKIAKVSHPDKTKNIYKNKLYDEAQIAYDENNLLVLYKVAKKLNIDIELNVSNLLLIEKIISDEKKELSSVETSFLWVWANTESQEKKDELINQFIKKHGE
jgi:hypothetical protein